MQETITNNRPKYIIGLPVSYFDFVKIKQAAKAVKMTTPEYLRARLGLEPFSESEEIKRKFFLINNK